MNLNDFNKLLWHHDWFSAYSDDHKVWQKGENDRQRFENIAKTSVYHKDLYQAWVKWSDDCINGTINPHPEPSSLYKNMLHTTEHKEELKQEINSSFNEYRKTL